VIRIVVVVAVLAAGLWGVGHWWQSRAKADADQPTNVRVERAVRGPLVESISAAGEVEPKTKVAISARVSARIAELPFKEGDRVTKGDPNATPPIPPSVLVRLDSKDLEAQLRSVEARSLAEKAQLKVSETRVAAQKSRIEALKVILADARRELGRKSGLLSSQDVSQSEVDQLQAKVDQQAAELLGAEAALKGEEGALVVSAHSIDAAEAEIAKARDNLNYATITSPIDGIVTRLNAEVGEVVVTGTMNNAGTVILEVADLSQMVLNAKVDESAIAQVKPEQRCKVRVEAYRDQVFDGVVKNVALANFDPAQSRGGSSGNRNMSSDGGKTFAVEILIDTKGYRFFSGLSADVDIEIKRYDDVVKVPSQAVLGRAPDSLPEGVRDRPEVDRSKASVPVVFRHVDGKAVATPVTIGASDLTHTIVSSGLNPGEAVIVNPYKVLENLKHDQKVKAENDPTSRPASTTSATSPTTRPAATSPS
jgi:HlyD family secretion protein